MSTTVDVPPTSDARLVSLDDPAARDATFAGVKAATLAELRLAGHRVPEGAVVLPSIEPNVAAQLIAATFAGGRVAVRSSAVAEDGATDSYAGQYRTLLNVSAEDPATIAEAIRSVRTSAADPARRGYGGASAPGMPVLVMAMVAADAAGVAFTANPLTGDDEVSVEAILGLGDALVAGDATPERWTARTGRAPLRADDSAAQVLTASQAQQIVDLALRVAHDRGAPQDIEWAWADGRVHLLQARPITALPIAPAVDVPPRETWLRADENFSQPLKPLEASIWFPRLEASARIVFAEAGAPIETMRHRLIGGWTYTRVVPPMDSGDDGAAQPPAFVFGLALRFVPALRRRMKTAARVWRANPSARLIHEWEATGRATMRARTRQLRDADRKGMDDAQLADHLVDIREHLQAASDVHFRLPVLATFLSMGRLGVLVERELGWSTERAFDLVQGFAELSTQAGRDLDRLASAITGDPRGSGLLTGDPVALASDDGPAGTALRQFLDVHGHQIVGFDLAHPTWAEDPRPLLQLVRARMSRGPHEARDPVAAAEAAADEARASLAARPRVLADFEDALASARRGRPYGDDTEIDVLAVMGVVRYWALEAGERLAQRGLLRRPDDVFYFTDDELVALLRGEQPLVDVARRRAEVRWAEAHPGAARYGPEPQPFPSLRWAPAGARPFLEAMVWSMERVAAPLVEQPAGIGLGGIAASPGTATGAARIIRGPAEFDRIEPGDVLVCRSTIAAWSVVFPVVSAIVTEVGGPLSHPAILAREFGIPAVLAVPGATERLRDGQLITVDGSRGLVHLEEEG